MLYTLASPDHPKKKSLCKCANTQNIYQSSCEFQDVFYDFTDQGKQNTSNHLLRHAPCELRPTLQQSCAGVNFYGLENAIKQVMKKQACVT